MSETTVENKTEESGCSCIDPDTVYRAGTIVGKTAAGLGLGVVAGIGTVIVASAVEVLVPAFLVLKAFGLTGGALGFLQGLKKD
ncbi:MAG TPA: hypothetical protein HPP76_08900 [Desulfuromonadales bacterium]|nr:hypothetical protein [Desulfuromonadales bacterium]